MTRTPSQRAREAAEAIVSAANIFTCGGYYEIDLDTVEVLVAQFEAETLEMAAGVADEHAGKAWAIADSQGQNPIVGSGRNHAGREIATAIRAMIGDPQ